MATIESDREKLFSVQEVAEQFGKTDGRIRQICRSLDLGTLYQGRVRLLKRRDIDRINRYLSESGKDFSSCT